MASERDANSAANKEASLSTAATQPTENQDAAQEAENQAEFVSLLIQGLKIQEANHRALEARVSDLEAKALADADPALQQRALGLHAEDVLNGRKTYPTFQTYMQYARTGMPPQQAYDQNWNSFPPNVYQPVMYPPQGSGHSTSPSAGMQSRQNIGPARERSLGETLSSDYGWAIEDCDILERTLAEMKR